MGKILIAYFSHTGENYNVGFIEKGNTAVIAEMIANETKGDLFEIKAKKKYSDNYMECINAAKEELRDKARPELAENADVSVYDIIFLGYPNWWGDAPMAVYTFLEGNDFVGKTIIPFCTHEGSGLGSTERKLKKVLPDTIFKQGLAVQGSKVYSAQESVKAFVNKIL